MKTQGSFKGIFTSMEHKWFYFFLFKAHVARGPGNQMLKLSLSLSLSHEPSDPILTVSNLVVRVGGGGVKQKVVRLK